MAEFWGKRGNRYRQRIWESESGYVNAESNFALYLDLKVWSVNDLLISSGISLFHSFVAEKEL